jgi:hypothetical protein
MQYQFTVLNPRRGYEFPVVQETVRGALSREQFQELIDNATFGKAYGVWNDGQFWTVRRVDIGHPC